MNQPPPPPWALIADDLTGACDAAAPFAERGIAAKVLLGRDQREIAHGGLTAVSTESRDLEPRAAAEKVAAAYSWLCTRGARLIFKKIDSVMRGNVIEEVGAVLGFGDFQRAVLTPAFPKMGRIVTGGKLIVPSQADFRPIDVRERFSEESSVQVADAVDDADVVDIVESAFQAEPPPLLVGSAGLATALASHLAARAPFRQNKPECPHCDAALYFIGSPHPVTTTQLDYLFGQRQCVVREFEGFEMDATARASDRLIVRTAWENPSVAQCAPLFRWLEIHPRAGIVLSGGDTAALFCKAAGARAIELGGEAFPGIPWGMLCGGRADDRFVVTKSGGFGAGQTLLDVDNFLGNSSQRS